MLTARARCRERCFGPGMAILFFMSVLLSGCAIAMPSFRLGEEFLKSHYIIAHEDGYPIAHGDEPPESPTISPRPELKPEVYEKRIKDQILAGIDAHARRLWPGSGEGLMVETPPLRILLFAHGGLNGYSDDFDRMREMMPGPESCGSEARQSPLFVSKVCGSAKTMYYPIFVNWNSGRWDSVFDDLFFIRFGHRRPELGWFTWPFIVGGRVAEAVFSAPNGWMANIQNFGDMEPGGAEWTEGIAMTPIRGLLTTPLLKAFGTSAWHIMKRRADLLVADRLDKALDLEGARERMKTSDPQQGSRKVREGAALTLVRMLKDRIEPLPNGSPGWKIGSSDGGRPSGPVEITLVGHSMGALVINRLLATQDDFPVKRIIYLAPAANIDEIRVLIGPYLKKNRKHGTDFRTFTLNRLDEARERDPTTLAPRGTLLVWIDNFFEPVFTPGDKRFGRKKAHLEYYGEGGLPSEPEVCELAATDPHRPRRHGEIDDALFLERVLWRVDESAFQRKGSGLEIRCILDATKRGLPSQK